MPISFKCSLNNYSSVLLALIFLLHTQLVFAQNIDKLNIEKVQDEGLTNTYVDNIIQDKNGFIWIGTGEGVFRYDGYSFKGFRNLPGDPTTLSNNQVSALYTEKNTLWVGMNPGLSCIDINTHAIKNITAFKSIEVNAIVHRDDSTFWIATATGLYVFNHDNFTCKLIPAVALNRPVSDVIDDHKGHLYLTGFDGFYCYTLQTQRYKFYSLNIPTYPANDKTTGHVILGRAVLDKAGNLWISTWGSGLLRFNTRTEKLDTWFHATDDVAFLPYKIVMKILPDENGNIWLANKEGGLTIYSPSTNKFVNYPVDWKSDNKISGPVLTLFRDRAGIVWIGTENGIYKFDPHHIYLSRTDFYLKSDSGLVPAHTSPLVMLKDREGQCWMGMYEGIFTYEEKTGVLTNRSVAAGIPKQYAFAAFNIAQDAQGAIWITARNLLIKVTKISKSAFKTETFKSPSIKSTIYKLYIDNEGRMWVGTVNNGIYRFDPGTKQFIPYGYEGSPINYRPNAIAAFCEISKDSILIGGYQTGLFLMHPSSGKYERVSLANARGLDNAFSVNSIYKTGHDLWIGTEDNGLWYSDTQFTKCFNITINDGLPSMAVELVTGDQHDNIWLLTNSGVVRYERHEKKLTVFDKREGIQNFALEAMTVDSNDNVSFACRGAMYNFNPATILKNRTPPAVLITDLRVIDKDYIIPKSETIELDYNQNYFTFEYVALNYTQSRLNKYAYKMAGLDKKWNYAGSRRYVSYANLDEGTYTFYVKACNNEGVWNNHPAKFTIIIHPPFWHRWWFYAVCSMLAVGSIYTLYWYNINQLKMRVQLRNKIARDLHDDIGSTLSGINIFTKIALQKLRRNEPGSSELLEKISIRSERTMDALSDIVWSISTKNDHIDNFLVKAREYLTETLEPQGIRYAMQIDEDIAYLKLGMEDTKEFYLIFKEAICNASKYAKCTFIEILLTKEKNIYSLTIRDNGCGFDMNKVSLGNGLQNMQHRAEKMRAKLDIISSPGEGAAITLSFRIPRFR